MIATTDQGKLIESIAVLRSFVNGLQLQTITNLARWSEEKDFFKEKIHSLAALITAMPKTYEQDGKGDDAIVHLHYFIGGCDWWITEKDIGTKEEPGQHQAFGFVNLNDPQCAELGYISIVELLANGVQLDLHWTPKPLGEVKKSINAE